MLRLLSFIISCPDDTQQKMYICGKLTCKCSRGHLSCRGTCCCSIIFIAQLFIRTPWRFTFISIKLNILLFLKKVRYCASPSLLFLSRPTKILTVHKHNKIGWCAMCWSLALFGELILIGQPTKPSCEARRRGDLKKFHQLMHFLISFLIFASYMGKKARGQKDPVTKLAAGQSTRQYLDPR